MKNEILTCRYLTWIELSILTKTAKQIHHRSCNVLRIGHCKLSSQLRRTDIIALLSGIPNTITLFAVLFAQQTTINLVPKHPSKCQSASDLHRRAEVTACKKNMIRAWLVKCRREKTPLCTSKQTFLKRHFYLQRNAKNSPKSRVAIFGICHHAQTHAILREVCPFLTTHLFKLVRFQINPVFVTPSIA